MIKLPEYSKTNLNLPFGDTIAWLLNKVELQFESKECKDVMFTFLIKELIELCLSFSTQGVMILITVENHKVLMFYE